MVICLERGAHLHMAHLMPLPLTVSCFSKIQIGFTFLVPAHPGSPRQRAVKQVCVCVCSVYFLWWSLCSILCPLLSFSIPISSLCGDDTHLFSFYPHQCEVAVDISQSCTPHCCCAEAKENGITAVGRVGLAAKPLLITMTSSNDKTASNLAPPQYDSDISMSTG